MESLAGAFTPGRISSNLLSDWFFGGLVATICPFGSAFRYSLRYAIMNLSVPRLNACNRCFLRFETIGRVLEMTMHKTSLVKGLWVWSLVYPLVVVWLVDVVISVMLGRDMALASEWLVKVFQMAIAAMPFVALAVCGEVLLGRGDRRSLRGLRFAAICIGAVSVVLWGAFYLDGVLAWRSNGLGGANIGLGLLVVFSPVVLSLMIPVTYLIGVKVAKE